MNLAGRTAIRLGVAFLLHLPPLLAQPRVTGVLNGASFSRMICAGAVISIFGDELAPATREANSIPLPVTLDGVTVLIDGNEVPLYFVSESQINAQIPFDVSERTVSLVVRTGSGESAGFRLDLMPTAPGLFTLTADGEGTPIISSPGFTLLDTFRSGQRVILYATGLGPTDPPAIAGAAGAGAGPLQRVVELPEVYVGAQQATVEFAGLAPGLAGVYQLNVVVPGDFISDEVFIVASGRRSNVARFSTSLPATVTNSGIPAVEDRGVQDFHRIHLLVVGSVEVRAGEQLSLRVEADDNILPLITTMVRNGTLIVSSSRPYRIREGTVRIIVTVPRLEHVALMGVGSVVASDLTGERFEVRLHGVGSVRASGSVDAVDLIMSGVGSAALFDLTSRNTSVWLSGVGTAEVNATESLFARVFGLGNVQYGGGPAEIDAVVDGLGGIRPR